MSWNLLEFLGMAGIGHGLCRFGPFFQSTLQIFHCLNQSLLFMHAKMCDRTGTAFSSLPEISTRAVTLNMALIFINLCRRSRLPPVAGTWWPASSDTSPQTTSSPSRWLLWPVYCFSQVCEDYITLENDIPLKNFKF